MFSFFLDILYSDDVLLSPLPGTLFKFNAGAIVGYRWSHSVESGRFTFPNSMSFRRGNTHMSTSDTPSPPRICQGLGFLSGPLKISFRHVLRFRSRFPFDGSSGRHDGIGMGVEAGRKDVSVRSLGRPLGGSRRGRHEAGSFSRGLGQGGRGSFVWAAIGW